MKIVLMNQSLYSQWQIPSLAAALSGAGIGGALAVIVASVTDEIDRRVRPERIEMEKYLA